VNGSETRERIALVATVLNEASSIDALLESVVCQTRLPDEIVIADGGSGDGTVERLERWRDRLPLRVLRAEGATIARGRNLAIAASTAEVLAVTDAGVRLAPDWLANLLARLGPDVDVVSGFFVPDARTTFERAMGATVLPAVEDVRPERFLPSSRSVLFRRTAWSAVGGYPEWLDYCEDLVFDLALRQSGCRFAFAPDALVYFRPRGSLSAFFKQYFRYARGDGKADLWRKRHAVRYATYLVAPWLARSGKSGWMILMAGGLAYCRRPLQRLMPQARALHGLQLALAVMLVPVIRLMGDLAKMLGYPVGVWWRWTSRSSS
jgi:glycosyltransferase involved in cell wall biosynthesis